ncbi:MAG: phosphatase PAP2 family protein [Bacteroidetes bacterium]|nr:phosphatase PAP2 family protein [Bacteroidota bacterium]MBS1757208.1 phosphatase PAP2 family protein [Bacteroidota bacterium]
MPVFIFLSGHCFSQSLMDTAKVDSEAYFKKPKIEKRASVKSFILPAVLITYGATTLGHNALHTLNVSTKNELVEDHPNFHTKVDNYLQYSPALAVYALNAFGVKGKNNFRDRTAIYALSTLISAAIVLPLKSITKEQRPDLSGYNSFPSGHTTTAFAAACFLQHEYKDVSPWYGIAGYAAATATGVLRMYNDRHWLGDVVAGAGFGILSTKLAYLIYPAIKKKIFKDKVSKTVCLPYIQSKGAGLALLYTFTK